MGIAISFLLNMFGPKREFRFLIVGLDNAGKTTLLNFLHVGHCASGNRSANNCHVGHREASGTNPENAESVTTPTVGFNVETCEAGGIKFQAWDLGGQASIRPYWRCYYGTNTHAIIFVVDSCDRERVSIARFELAKMLMEEELQGAIILVLANKQDVNGCMSAAEISCALQLHQLASRHTHKIFQTSTKTGAGVFEAVDWLATAVS